MMTSAELVVTLIIMTIATLITRFTPFLIFNGRRETPAFVRYLGQILPPAIFGMLIVYSLRSVDVLRGTHGLPEAIAILVTVSLHLWKRQMLLSIAGGTVTYMVLVQLIV